MASSQTVGGQLTDMINALRRYEKTTTSAGPQTTDLSFMTLIWPLLPLLPPEPPIILTELLRNPEMCDLCGTCQSNTVTSFSKPPQSGYKVKTQQGVVQSAPSTGSELRRRGITPLDRLMTNIENKMDETLSSIRETTMKSTELSIKAKGIEKSKMGDMTDSELLKTLKTLTKVKAERAEKVKILEVKEQQLKESLMTAIEWAKSIETSKPGLVDEKVDFKNITEVQEALAKVSAIADEGKKSVPEIEQSVTDKQELSLPN